MEILHTAAMFIGMAVILVGALLGFIAACGLLYDRMLRFFGLHIWIMRFIVHRKKFMEWYKENGKL